MKESPGDFASVMADVNQMKNAAITHPFGMPMQGLAHPRQQNAGIPQRQTTEVFYLPKGAAEYDNLMNRAWAGEIQIRYEERTFTKESEVVIIVCWFAQVVQPRPNDVAADGDQEPEEKSRKLP